MKKVRVRFAPSPTGGLHLGGIRTVLYNYLFARRHHGSFVLRIEDTDQTRYVPGAEEYIFNCLEWCGLVPDESPLNGGAYGPYRQSERKEIYRKYAEQLIENGFAYYAFDTPEDLEQMRNNFKTEASPSTNGSSGQPTVQYDHKVRMKMKNSISLPDHEVKKLLDSGTRHVIRIKMPENETITFTDLIRGEIQFDAGTVDDKVLLKADGMPTYHLAVVVDDYLMKITHAFRGEEWLPSAPVHLLLWKYLGWETDMPQWAHLPLILGPGGKLSKRDALKYGFPVFAMNWTDPKTNELIEGFKEKGFLPEAFINFLALLGWNDGTEQEIFTLEELIQRFSIERVHSGGAKFDYEKAKWFNHEWIKRMNISDFRSQIGKFLPIGDYDHSYIDQVIKLVKDRCTLLTDFTDQSQFFFNAPQEYDLNAVKPKWSESKKTFFDSFIDELKAIELWEPAFIEDGFKKLALIQGIKAGDLQLPFRIMLVGGKFGPPVFEIAAVLGKEETIERIQKALGAFA
ncbi:MAG TPA: glutamate--tRNA ligase [Chitinophagaceae bacterium]|nr:glutamate--tRNA ligase [Chitinophagaceae bacterium]